MSENEPSSTAACHLRPASTSRTLPNLPVTEPSNLERLHIYGGGESVVGAAYRSTFSDGPTRNGVADASATLSGVSGMGTNVVYCANPRDNGLKPHEWADRQADTGHAV